MSSEQFFLSYSRKNSAFALKLTNDLRKAGINVWFDKLDIVAGSLWDQEIEKAIQTCSSMIVIISTSSVDSRNVMDEVSYAIRKNKHVIPLILDNCEIPLRVRRLHWIDFTADYKSGLKHLLKTLSLNNGEKEEALSASAENKTIAKPIKRKSYVKWLFFILLVIAVSILGMTGYLKNQASDKGFVGVSKNTADSILTKNVENKKEDSIAKVNIPVKADKQPVYTSPEKDNHDAKRSLSINKPKPSIKDLVLDKLSPGFDVNEGYWEYEIKVKNISYVLTYYDIYIDNNKGSKPVSIKSLAPGQYKELKITMESEDCDFWIREPPSAEFKQ